MIRLLYPRRSAPVSHSTRRGFTLVELMVTLVVLAVVVVVLTAVMYTTARNKTTVSNRVEAVQAARVAIDMMARDLRSAGYGADLDYGPLPQPPIAYVDSLQVLINANFVGDVATRDTVAYDPAGNPKPFPLVGTSWTPPIKYRTGAEVIRWTLDANNDGVVDASDQTAANAIDAQRTPNPNDYELIREVYGDSTGDVAGNNGGTVERIALVRRPGSGAPAMFMVYMKGLSNPWDWSNGPVPAAQLADIQRIVIQVVAPSGRVDAQGNFSEVNLQAEVNSLRNVPDFGQVEYAVDGFVYDDANTNHVKDGGESGIPSTAVFLGKTFSTTTDANGYFLFKAPQGTYTLKHQPTAAYGNFNDPDSFVVTVGPPVTKLFADTARSGGWVTAYVYNDLNGNGSQDGGELGKSSVKVTLTPGGDTRYTDGSGYSSLFAQTGGYSVTVTPPDSYIVSTPNPVAGVMTTGGSTSETFGVTQVPMGKVRGKVFRDNNRNAAYDAGEPGIPNVWVGVTPDGGVTVHGYAYTDVNGDYEVEVPANDPPATTPDYAMVIVPSGYFPTGTTSVGPLWIQASQTLTGNNFGMAAYQVITLNASRVLSLASGNLIEKDWNGNQTQYAREDVDLVLGADAGGTDNVSVWFNQYDGSPLFTANATYTRNAPQSVLAVVLDTLDSNAPKQRLDLVTGTRSTASGNFFVWFNQNSSGNEGYFPTTFSTGKNYKTTDAGDVQAALAFDCAGLLTPDQLDLIVGTRSPTANQGTIEVWASDNAATPSFSRVETYPPAGTIPGNRLGEVNAMALADFDNDGRRDLVVGTKTGTYSGQLLFFMNVSKSTGARFVYQAGYDLSDQAATALVCTDVDQDGEMDVVIGTQTSTSGGRLEYWRNNKITPGVWKFDLERRVAAPGIVMSMVAGDYGGTSVNDIAVGFRSDASTYVGGLRIYFLDSKTLPLFGADPSSGTLVNMVPALTVSNFNYGVQPALPSPPYLADLAAGIKTSATTGALVIFIR